MVTVPTSAPRTRLLAASRYDEILRRIGAAGSVSISELSDLFGVSRETIRRDFRYLAERGQLDIVHGGAARRQAVEPALDQRAAENAAGKAAIGRFAATLVEDEMVVLLDSGTTTLAVAQALAVTRRGLTVCTGSLGIAQLLCRVTGTRVHMLGGEIDPNDEAAVGIDALEAIGRFRVDVAFVGVGGLSDDGEPTDYTRVGAEQRGRMIAVARRAYFVVDRSKFGRLTPVRIPNARAATGIIVDAPPPAGTAAALADRDLRLIVAEH
jgi:DeoR family glycerol-3-phosphate regulon repressor